MSAILLEVASSTGCSLNIELIEFIVLISGRLRSQGSEIGRLTITHHSIRLVSVLSCILLLLVLLVIVHLGQVFNSLVCLLLLLVDDVLLVVQKILDDSPCASVLILFYQVVLGWLLLLLYGLLLGLVRLRKVLMRLRLPVIKQIMRISLF